MKLFSRIAGLLLITAISVTSVFAQKTQPPVVNLPTDAKSLINGIKTITDRSIYQYISALAQLNDPEGNAVLLAQLKENKSPQVRQQIVRSIAQLTNDEKVVDALVVCLKDPDQNLRADAFQSLCRIANPKSLPTVLAFYNEQDPKNKMRLSYNLSNYGTAIVEPLLEMYKTADATFKPIYMGILTRTRDERVIEPLLETYSNETNPNSKMMMIYNMGPFINNKRILDVMLEAVKSRDIAVSKAAITMIANQNDPSTIAPLLNAYPTIVPESKVAMLDAIGRMPDPRFTTCILGLKDDVETVRVQAATTLGLLKNDRAIEPLKNLLNKDASKNVKVAAAYSLAQLGAEGMGDVLLGMMNETDVNIKEKVIRALTTIGDKRAIPLITKLLNDPDQRIKYASYNALGVMKDPDSIKAIGDVMKVDDVNTKMMAARTLGQIGDTKATEYLLPLLNEKDFNLRSTAVRALGDIKSIESTPILLILLDEKTADPQQQWQLVNLKSSVLNALGNIADPATAPIVIEYASVPETSNAATNALRTMGKVAAPALIEALNGDSAEKKQVGIDVIGSSGSQEAVPLLEKLTSDKANLLTAITAVRALGELKNNGANVGDMEKYIDMLINGAKSAERKMVNESFKALGTLKSDKAVGALSALKTENPQLSSQVYQALGQIATPTAVNTLITMKKETTDINVKNQIIQILGRTGDASAIVSLTEDLKNPALKANAAWAISLLSGEGNEKIDGTSSGGGGRPGRNNYGGGAARYDDTNLKGGHAPNGITWQ